MITKAELTILDDLFKVISEIMLTTTIPLHFNCDGALNQSILTPGSYTQSICFMLHEESHDMYYTYDPKNDHLEIDEDRLCELVKILKRELLTYKCEWCHSCDHNDTQRDEDTDHHWCNTCDNWATDPEGCIY